MLGGTIGSSLYFGRKGFSSPGKPQGYLATDQGFHRCTNVIGSICEHVLSLEYGKHWCLQGRNLLSKFKGKCQTQCCTTILLKVGSGIGATQIWYILNIHLFD